MHFTVVAHKIGPYGGQELVMERAAVELSRQGHRVDLVAYQVSDTARAFCNVRRVRRVRGLFLVQFVAFYLMAPRLIEPGTSVITCGAIIPTRADAVWMHFWHRENLLSSGWFCGYNGNLLQFIVQSFSRAVALAAERVILSKKFDRTLIAVSKSSAKTLAQHYPRARVLVIENSVDIDERFVAGEPQVRQAPTVLFVGGEWGRKGLALILDALDAIATTTGREIELKILGRGPVKFLKRSRSDFLKISHTNWSNDVGAQMATADVFVTASSYETFSVAGHEALALGLPVITTDVHALADSVRATGCGYVVDRSARSIQNALESVLFGHSIPEEQRQAAREFMRSKFDGQAITERLRVVAANLQKQEQAGGTK